MKFYNFFILLLFSISATTLTGQTLVVKLRPGVTVEKVSGKSAAFASNDPALDQLLQANPPKEIVANRFSRLAPEHLPEGFENIQVWEYASPARANAVLSQLTRQASIVYAEPNHAYRLFTETDDPLVTEQFYLISLRAEAGWQINRGRPDVIVGVIDTGVDYLHEDLQGQLWVNSPEDLNRNGMLDSTDLNGIDDDGNGYIDDVIGWDFTDAPNFPDQGDFLDPDNDPMDEFSSGHGTPVAGIIAAAQDNRVGISGIAPGARVMALRAGTASGFLEEDDVAEAILYAVANGCRIVNMSFGDAAISFLLRDAIRFGVSQGVAFVASAGNSGGAAPNYPAAFDETISVSAANRFGEIAPFSSFGSTIDMTAPGEEIFSLQIGNGYGLHNGTSFSAPMVSAALALIWSEYPNLSLAQAQSALFAGSRDLGAPGWDPQFGHGVPDLGAILYIGGYGYAGITSPAMQDGSAEAQWTITGTVFSPALLEYQLFYGVGESPLEYLPIAPPLAQQRIEDTLAVWDISQLPDNLYTIELRMRQSGAPDVVRHTQVHIDHSPPQLLSLQKIPLWIGPHRAVMFRLATDDPCNVTMLARPVGQPTFNFSRRTAYFRNEHYLILSREDVQDNLEVFFQLENSAGLISDADSSGQYYRADLSRPLAAENLLQPLASYPIQGYFLPDASDLDQDNRPEMIISSLVNGREFGPLQVWEYQDSNFELRFQSQQPLIPRDVQRLVPTGEFHVLSGYGDHSFLLKAPAGGGWPLQLVWQDSADFWGSRLRNLDSDAATEILAVHSALWRIYDINSGYRVAERQTLPNPSEGNNQTGAPTSVIADFDGDGFPEIVYEDLDGDLTVYEQNGSGSFQFVTTLKMPGQGSASLLCAGDLDGDGRDELLSAAQNRPSQLLESNINAQYWAVTAWKTTANNQYELAARANIQGIKTQPGFFNGLRCVDLDGDQRAEVILTVFPDLYVLRLVNRALEPVFYRDDVNSNTVLAADFNGNGLPELLINSNAGMIHLESAGAPERPPAPASFQARPLDTSTVSLAWQTAPGALFHRIYRGAHPDSLQVIDSTASTTYLDTNLAALQRYYYAVSQIDPQFPIPESPLSIIRMARPNPPPRLVSIEVVSEHQLRLGFSEALSEGSFMAHNFFLDQPDQPPSSAIRGKNRREILLTFREILIGRSHIIGMSNLSDSENTPMSADPLLMRVPLLPGLESFYVEEVRFIDRERLEVLFNLPADPATAEDTTHFALEPFDEILSARLSSENPRKVILSLRGRNRMGDLGEAYYLIVKDVQSRSGSPLADQGGNRLLIRAEAENLDNMIVYPNPFRLPSAVEGIMFARVPRGAQIFIFNANGVRIKTLEQQNDFAGVKWDLRNESGREVGSGVYLYLVKWNERQRTGKVMVIK